MSYTTNLALGEIAYDGFHAIDDTYVAFDKLPKEVQERWAQGARNACDAWNKPGGVDVDHWREATRAAHAEIRAERKAKGPSDDEAMLEAAFKANHPTAEDLVGRLEHTFRVEDEQKRWREIFTVVIGACAQTAMHIPQDPRVEPAKYHELVSNVTAGLAVAMTNAAIRAEREHLGAAP